MTNEPSAEVPFGRAAGRFLERLAQHSTREWFTAHRDEYDRLLAEPLEHLLTTAEAYGPGRVMRPQRDVRFSRDKTPYKTTASLWAGRVGAVYLQVDHAGLLVGGGLYEPSRDQLGRAREAITEHPAVAGRLTTVLDALEESGFELAGPALATAPRGYPRDHPRIRLLRLRHYAALRRLPLDATTEQVHRTWTAVEPLNAWVERHVGAPQQD